jgi:nitric oxide reductase large subunit
MGRLWQVGLGLALAWVCLMIAQTQTVTRDKNPPGALIHYVVTEPTGWGNFLTFFAWFLIVVAVLNLFKWFGGK